MTASVYSVQIYVSYSPHLFSHIYSIIIYNYLFIITISSIYIIHLFFITFYLLFYSYYFFCAEFLSKWVSEPLRAVIVSTKLFLINKKKKLFLPSKFHEILLYFSAKFQVWNHTYFSSILFISCFCVSASYRTSVHSTMSYHRHLLLRHSLLTTAYVTLPVPVTHTPHAAACYRTRPYGQPVGIHYLLLLRLHPEHIRQRERQKVTRSYKNITAVICI
jgi:hypothetical protein